MPDRSTHRTNPASPWDWLTGRLLKKWAGKSSPSGHIRARLLAMADTAPRGMSWIERSYWLQEGKAPRSSQWGDVLSPMEIRALSLYSLTICAMQQPGYVTYT